MVEYIKHTTKFLNKQNISSYRVHERRDSHAQRITFLPGEPGTDSRVFQGPPAFERHGREELLRDRCKNRKEALSLYGESHQRGYPGRGYVSDKQQMKEANMQPFEAHLCREMYISGAREKARRRAREERKRTRMENRRRRFSFFWKAVLFIAALLLLLLLFPA